ncbi:MAG: bis(5'-nucleosyl)-tetraphosphatase (symmetrical) YqeK [Finegoldia sp.]|nr:bis(5'-nucleosyl)-tetraphosphatase (symmetrical) YqeK [Finegoldia sp.]
MKTKEIEKRLEKVLSEKRYKHVLRVRDKAIELGKLYDLDLEKLEVAALLHDCAKENEETYLKKYREDFERLKKENPDPDMDNKKTLHCALGRIVAEKEYGIEDPDILNAIQNHTSGRVGMSDFEKLIYLADKTEDGRDYQGVDEIRELSEKNLSKAIAKSIDNTLKYLIDSGSLITGKVIEVRNYLIENEK